MGQTVVDWPLIWLHYMHDFGVNKDIWPVRTLKEQIHWTKHTTRKCKPPADVIFYLRSFRDVKSENSTATSFVFVHDSTHPKIKLVLVIHNGPGSSVGIGTELLAGRSEIESRWGQDFPPVQTGPGAHPASCKMGTGYFPGVKCGRGVLLTTHPFLVPRSWKSRVIHLPTLWAIPGLKRENFTFYLYLSLVICSIYLIQTFHSNKWISYRTCQE